MMNFIINPCRRAVGLSIVLASKLVPGLKSLVPVLDMFKGTMVWLAELIAFVSISALIIHAAMDFYNGDPHSGLLAIAGSLLLGLLILIIGITMNPQMNERKKK